MVPPLPFCQQLPVTTADHLNEGSTGHTTSSMSFGRVFRKLTPLHYLVAAG